MKILVIGAKGQLGNEILDMIKLGKAEIGELSENIKSSEVIALDIEELDITELNSIRKTFNYYKPNIIINCAAFTNVDSCEINKELAFKVNAIGSRNLAIIAEEISAKLVHISTDYVFKGDSEEDLAEYESREPISVYGKTKLLGEEYVREFSTKYFIIRTAWLYGAKGKNFVYTMLKLGMEKEALKVVNDQVGNPTNANDLAYHILKLIETEEYGIYHCTGNGRCSWYEFAKEIMKIKSINCEITPCTSEEYKVIAKRPKYSALDNMMLRETVGDEMREWKEALRSFLKNI